MIATIILSGIIGLVIGLLWCYWKTLSAAYANKDIIASGANLGSAVSDFYGNVKAKL